MNSLANKRKALTVLLAIIAAIFLAIAMAFAEQTQNASAQTEGKSVNSSFAQEKVQAPEKIWEVYVPETGTLRQTLTAMDGYAQEAIEGIKIATADGAYLNYEDFSFLRVDLFNLKYLDIEEADCVNDYDLENVVYHEIPRNAMQSSGIVTLKLSTKVTSIGQYAFGECGQLRGDLVIPDNVEAIQKVAFGCWGSKYPQCDSLTLSKNLKFLGAGAFLRCKFGGGLTLPATLEKAEGDGTYGGCFQANGFDGPLVFEEGCPLLTEIPRLFFNGCSGLTGDIVIPENVTTIKSQVFDGCSGLTGKLVLSSMLETMEASFASLSIEEVVFEDGFHAANLPNNTFVNSATLKKVTLGEGMTEFPIGMFSGCKALTGDIVIPDSVTTIGQNAFYNTAITSVQFGNSLVSIGPSAFRNCTSLSGDLIIPDSVTTIGNYAFNNCSALNGELHLSNRLEKIEPYTFTSMHFSNGLTIPDSVVSIGANAFQSASFNGELNLGENIQIIEKEAFYNVSGLTGNIDLPSAISIGVNAFRNMSLNGTLTLGDNVQTIDKTAFYGTKLTGTLVLPESLTVLGTQAFTGANFRGVLYVPQGVTCLNLDGTLATNIFQNCHGIEKIEYHGSGDAKAFGANGSAIKEINYSDSGITEFTISGANLATLNLSNCTSLTKVTAENKANLQNVDLTGCTALASGSLKNCAIDFTGGTARESLELFKAAGVDVNGQKPVLSVETADSLIQLDYGKTFDLNDAYRIFTFNGTELTAQNWEEQVSQWNTEGWVNTSWFDKTYPIVRTVTKDGETVELNELTDSGAYVVSYTYKRNGGNSLMATYLLPFQTLVTIADESGEQPEEPAVPPVIANKDGGVITSSITIDFTPTYTFRLNYAGSLDGKTVTWQVCNQDGSENTDGIIEFIGNDGTIRIMHAGIVYIRAGVNDVYCKPVKVTINKRAITFTSNGRSKIYGTDDSTNLGATIPSGVNGEDFGVSIGRVSGEDVGVYYYFYYFNETGYEAALSAFQNDSAQYVADLTAEFANKFTDYNLTYNWNANNFKFTINQASLGVASFSAAAKNYDGTNTVTLSRADGELITGILNNELSVAVVKYFEDVNAGTGVNVKLIITLTGAKLKNYKIPANNTAYTWTVNTDDDGNIVSVVCERTNLKANINKVTLTAYSQFGDKVYDGTNRFDLTFDLIGLVEHDKQYISQIYGETEDKNVGSQKIVKLVCKDSDGNILIDFYKNYTIKEDFFKSNITPRPLDVSGEFAAENKIYDGTTNAVISGNPLLDESNIVEGDDVSFDSNAILTGMFYNADVGINKTVVLAIGSGLTGDDAGNYYLRPLESVKANILPREVYVLPDADQQKVNGADDPTLTYKVYDKTTGDLLEASFNGKLRRAEGEAYGLYDYDVSSLYSFNYTIALSPEAGQFEILPNDSDYIEMAKKAVAELAKQALTGNIELPTELTFGDVTVQLVWETKAGTALTAEGIVTRPGCSADNAIVKMGVTFKVNETEQTENYDFTVLKLEHEYDAVVTAPTCEDDGYTTHTCAACGDSYKDSETAAFGHDYTIEWTWSEDGKTASAIITCAHDAAHVESGEAVITSEVKTHATCESKGVTAYTAKITLGGTEYTAVKDVEDIDALGHTYGEWVNEVPATCTETGTKGHKTCSVCNKHFDSEGNEIADLTIAALGHDYATEWTTDKAPTCMEAGSKFHHCSRCESKSDVTEIPALGHDWDEWTVTKEATEDAEGEETRVCKHDGTHTETRVIPKLEPSITTNEIIDLSVGGVVVVGLGAAVVVLLIKRRRRM